MKGMLPQTAKAGQQKAVSKLMVKFTVFIKTKTHQSTKGGGDSSVVRAPDS